MEQLISLHIYSAVSKDTHSLLFKTEMQPTHALSSFSKNDMFTKPWVCFFFSHRHLKPQIYHRRALCLPCCELSVLSVKIKCQIQKRVCLLFWPLRLV